MIRAAGTLPMVTIAAVIAMLRSRQIEQLRAGVMTPKGKEAFDFGVVSGTALAYEQMLEDIEALTEADANREKEREKSK